MGYCLKYDVSLRTESYYKLVEKARKFIKDAESLTNDEKNQIVTNGYGHLGDGNLHLNITCPGYENKHLQQELSALLDPFVM